MKKTYSKPEVVFESFQLNTAIAGNCTPGVATPGMYDCYEGGYSQDTCEIPTTCYDIPSEGSVMFTS